MKRAIRRGIVVKKLTLILPIITMLTIGAVNHASHAQSILVLTAEEFDANLNYRERGGNILKKPGDPLAPQIIVDAPDIGTDVAPPVSISVRFQPAGDASIDLESLRVKYGWFDITKRVLESMEVSPDGISGQIGSMRRGKYTLKLSIKDSMNRQSDAIIAFTVVQLNADAR